MLKSLFLVVIAVNVVCSVLAETCPENEYYDTCSNAGCRHWDCTTVDMPELCVSVRKCHAGCICNEGYTRGLHEKCIPKTECNKHLCPNPNEVYEMCPRICSPRVCGVENREVQCSERSCQKSGCRCIDGTYRNSTGICVAWEDCS